ncbi:SnoaL-like domain protein [Vibrio ruber DSM 16370]|uniref:SnoaL-like domain protein n=1 Tax=Vibrio ruber (strain DSM 16370 / JCM 11486 / BCRC 17186 / CECT 7878 / LMG 23124 / VR1) TaxID=1123498 RepID=A0A1R4LUB7_VIBR1|nr:nuclear transport factor 2 family protein [Vibrio ruber]SJN60078.1 SnoaL-like domain protein [Vibrio ruber DSM 16370]
MELFDRYIAAVMKKSSDGLAELFTAEGRLSMPFRRSREVVTGRENIRLHYANGFSVAPLCFTSIQDVNFHYTNDPDVAVIEYKLNGYTLPEKKTFILSYVNVIHVSDGKISELVDYEDVLNRDDIFNS